jgi:peptidoglycan hydrolase-like protein with peptidoglycan-binding domain
MRKIAIALLASTVIGTPAFAASSDMQRQQQPKAHEMQPQHSGKAQTRNAPQRSAKSQQGSSPQTTRSAANDRAISPQRFSRQEIRQVQQTLDKDGFHAGPADGHWGPETRGAIKQFQQSKDIRADGRLNRQTMADLGLSASQFPQRSKAQGM